MIKMIITDLELFFFCALCRVRILPGCRMQRKKRDYRPDNEQTEPETMTVTGQRKRCPFLFYAGAIILPENKTGLWP